MVTVEGQKCEGKRSISVSLHSRYEFSDRHSPFEGFEVFKLSNHDMSLASPNPPLPPNPRRVVATESSVTQKVVVIFLLCLSNVFILLLLRRVWFGEESGKAKRFCRCFSLAEIKVATKSFHEGFVVGKGGFGKVYKGFVDNGREMVAVKRLKPGSKQGEREFLTEIETLDKLRHDNLVSLLGYCKEKNEMILVYEFMPNGTLADHLYKRSDRLQPLSWVQRLKICIGVGRAIDYLHTGREIIHRDVKSSNILLDEMFVAKVSDFGLAKCTAGGSEGQTTLVKGTRGYLDPNYGATRRVTQKSDTYSFGVVLLEVLSERAAADGVATWAKERIGNGEVGEVVARSLRGEISADSLATFVGVAERCVADEPKQRPEMTEIIIQLELALVQQQQRYGVASFTHNLNI